MDAAHQDPHPNVLSVPLPTTPGEGADNSLPPSPPLQHHQQWVRTISLPVGSHLLLSLLLPSA